MSHCLKQVTSKVVTVKVNHYKSYLTYVGLLNVDKHKEYPIGYSFDTYQNTISLFVSTLSVPALPLPSFPLPSPSAHSGSPSLPFGGRQGRNQWFLNWWSQSPRDEPVNHLNVETQGYSDFPISQNKSVPQHSVRVDGEPGLGRQRLPWAVSRDQRLGRGSLQGVDRRGNQTRRFVRVVSRLTPCTLQISFIWC